MFLNLKLKENNELLPSFESIMGDESGLANELVLLAYNIQKEVCCVLSFPNNRKHITWFS
jgi:hypothetical protein